MITAIAIDDERHALEVISILCKRHPGIQLIKTFLSSIQAKEYLKFNSVDLIFLDIHMSDLSGMDFLESLMNAPPVIFTTAHSEYAVRSYEYDAVDYLLKPISFNRFTSAIEKFQRSIKGKEIVKYIFSTSKGKLSINSSETLYIKSMGNFSILTTSSGNVVLSDSLKGIEEMNYPGLIRVHRSFIINGKSISMIGGSGLLMGQQQIPIGRAYKKRLLEFLKKQD